MRIVCDLFIMGRVALAAIDRSHCLMVFLGCLDVTFQARRSFVAGCPMIIRHFFMAFGTLRIGVTLA